MAEQSYNDAEVRAMMEKEMREGKTEIPKPKENKFRDGVNRTVSGIVNVAKGIGKDLQENNSKKKKSNNNSFVMYSGNNTQNAFGGGGMFRNPDAGVKKGKKSFGGSNMFNSSMLKEKAQNNIFNTGALNERKGKKQKGFRFMY